MHSKALVAMGSLLVAATALAQQVTKEPVAGIRNLARLETTVACAGAITAESVPEIKKMGFVSIVNLRRAAEPGAEVEKEEAAAKASGLRYFHVPFDGTPDRPRRISFLKSHHLAGGRAAFIHCAGGNRAATRADQALAVEGGTRTRD